MILIHRFRCVALAAMLGAVASPGFAGTITGKFVVPGLGAVSNGTLLLTLSQAAVAPGSYAVVPSTSACATSTDGSVVGVPNPLVAPGGAAFPGSGTLGIGTYFVVIAYTAPGAAITLPSAEAVFSLSAPGRLQINAPALSPARATGYAVYLGTASAAETLQGTAPLGTAFTQATPLSAGAPPPGANSTTCTLAFDDAMIPAFTYYEAQLSDSAGNVLPGYPQNWYLSGASLDVSNIMPLASNPAVRFPMPVLANPASTAAQSVGSGLYLNGFGIGGSGNVGPGFYSAYWAGAEPAAGTTLASWTPNTAVTLRRLDINAQTAGTGGTAGATITISDGTTTCTFGGLLIAAATATSDGLAVGGCGFGAGIGLTVKLAGDDHATAPQGLSWSIELTSR